MTGLPDGSLDQVQYNWLIAQLNTHSSRRLDTIGKCVKGRGQDRLMVIFSHHTVDTTENVLGASRVNATMIDHAAPISHGRKPTTPLQLAALSRERGINDWQRPVPPLTD